MINNQPTGICIRCKLNGSTNMVPLHKSLHRLMKLCCLSAALLQLRWETNVKNGVCGVSFDRRDIPMNKFMVTCLESAFHVFDARTQNPSKVSKHGQLIH